MQLDQTWIAIRRRTILEIMDLSLHVIHEYWAPLFFLLLFGAIPLTLFDWLFCVILPLDDLGNHEIVLYIMTCLIFLQAQFGTIFITAYLGEATFVGRPVVFTVIKSAVAKLPQLFWVHGVWRLLLASFLLPVFYLADMLPPGGWLPVCVLVCLAARCFRPFVNEILILERTPLNSPNGDRITYRKRTKALHAPSSGDLIGRALTIGLLIVPIIGMFHAFLFFLFAMASMNWFYQPARITICWIFGLWMTAGFIAVIRFLSYIDVRIRQEAWDVELQLRAEAMQLEEVL